MNEIFVKAESVLQGEAKKYCPEGTEIRAIVHQWLHAIAHNTSLFGEHAGAKKATIIKALKTKKIYSNQKDFKALLYSNLKLAPVNNPKFTFIDLFAGIGGMRLGSQFQHGLCVFSSEFDRFAQETYQNNYSEFPFGDITKVDAANIPDHDLLMAGFPCQPFSYAGLCEGFEDQTRGTLFFDVLRIIEEKLPKIVLLENVKGFKSHEKGTTMDIALRALEEIGYHPKWKILNSYDFGVSQYRERWYCIATRENVDFDFPEGKLRGSKLRDIVDKTNHDPLLRISDFEISRIKHHFASEDVRVEHDNSKYEPHTKKGRHGVFSYQKPDGALRFHIGDVAKTQIQEAFYACLNTYAPAIIANRTPKLWDIERKLSVKECLKLQGFPDEFSFNVSNAQAYKQLGNSVTVPVVRAIMERIIDSKVV